MVVSTIYKPCYAEDLSHQIFRLLSIQIKNNSMFKTIKFSFLSVVLFFGLSLMISCSDSEEVSLESVQDFVVASIDDLESQGKIGRLGCYEFVFPITINFPDDTSTSSEDYDMLRESISAWKEANPDAEERPSLAFPIELTTENGEVVSVESREALIELRRECKRDFIRSRNNIRRFVRRACFDLVYPISIEFSDGSIVEASSQAALKRALRAWKRRAGERAERPSLIFPITVEFEDGTQVTVNDRVELVALKDSCEEEGEE